MAQFIHRKENGMASRVKQNRKVVRPIVGTALVLIAAAFTLYLSVVMVHRINTVVLKESYIEVFQYELILCGILLIAALDLRFSFLTIPHLKLLRAVGWIIRILLISMSAIILFFFGKITTGSLIRTAGPADHAIVLGLALENGRPTEDLLNRLDTAEQYMQMYPEAKLILTGGNPDASGKTEAAAMHDLLVSRGIFEEKMILEDRAESTEQNFENTRQIVDPDKPVVLITNGYHMDRAAQIARKAGFTRVMPLPAPSSPLLFGANVVWEIVMELNDLTLKKK